jgi:hypothetical protein
MHTLTVYINTVNVSSIHHQTPIVQTMTGEQQQLLSAISSSGTINDKTVNNDTSQPNSNAMNNTNENIKFID